MNVILIPAYEPDEELISLTKRLKETGFAVVVVNDGSGPAYDRIFDAVKDFAHILVHERNKGKGAALKNAFRWFLENRPDAYGVVTVDGDNQHHPEDTRACCEHMLDTGKVTLGCRDFSLPHVPSRSRFGNHTTSTIFKIFVGMTISDTQTGLRAIPRTALETLVNIAGERFEYETNMLLAMKDNAIDFDEVKIRTVYIEENKSSHFRVIHDSWRIYKLILAHFFRYTASSIASFVIDSSMVFLLTKVLGSFLVDPLLSGISTVGARVVSSLINFFMNKKLVFQSKVSTGKAMLRYYALAVPQLIVQWLANQGLYTLLGITEQQAGLRTVIHILVMCVLFLVSFTIQQRWVFAPEKSK